MATQPEWEGGELLFAGGTDFFAVQPLLDFFFVLMLSAIPFRCQCLKRNFLQVGRHATLRTKKKSEKEQEVILQVPMRLKKR